MSTSQTLHQTRFLEVDGIGKVTLEFSEFAYDWEDYTKIRVWNMSREGMKLGLAREKAAISGKQTTWTFDNYPHAKIVIKTKSLKHALLAAAAQGNTRAVLELVKKGADPHRGNHNGETPLFLAASAGHTQTVRALVQECGAKSSSNTASQNGTTPLCAAASNGHTETVRALVLEFGAIPNTATTLSLSNARHTPVYRSAVNGHMETVRVLVHECGASPKPLEDALFYAAMEGKDEMIWTLVRDFGVNPARLNFHYNWNKPRDFVSPGSRTYMLLEWLEEAADGKDAPYKNHNDDKRAEEIDCPVCLEELKGDAIAIVPCGHRVCPGCWAKMRAKHEDKCPQCRAPIAHGVRQDLWPNQHPMYSRFCVEVPRARRL